MSSTLRDHAEFLTTPHPSPQPFHLGRALAHVESLAYPRRVGTLRERRAARYIARHFQALGLTFHRERFGVPKLARELGARLVIALCAALVLAGAWLWDGAPWAAAAVWVAAAALVNAPWTLALPMGQHWPRPVVSQNLIATLPTNAPPDAPTRVVFMAHYDTKSQLLPTGVRVGLVFAATGLCAALALAATSTAAWGARPSLNLSAAYVPGTVLLILALLAANLTGNHSPGALDNGTGLGALLELARTWRPRPDAPAEVLWIATGSEETGLDGARDFLRRHEAWWREKPTLLVNLDSVGAGERIHLSGEPTSLALAESVAAELGLPSARLRVLGAAMDHLPFSARGLCAVTILGDVIGRSLAMHSRRDTTRIVEPDALERAATLAAHFAWAWAERYQPPATSRASAARQEVLS